jgi:hypothetical protein
MRKLIITMLTILCLVGNSKPVPTSEHTMYIMSGHYYACGEVITEDGNVWGYTDGTIGNNESVNVLFDDMGTPDYIYDDEVIGLVSR